IEIKIPTGIDGFMEDKEAAKEFRRNQIIPALQAGETVVLDFSGVKYVTQSFIHALIHEALKRFGEEVLDRFEFRNCSKPVKTIIEMVVEYSYDGFQSRGATAA
ncbi:MAG: STAS-like domain-containing protein, partial [Acidobacteriota bacterium]